MFSSHGGLLTNAMYHHGETLSKLKNNIIFYCIFYFIYKFDFHYVGVVFVLNIIISIFSIYKSEVNSHIRVFLCMLLCNGLAILSACI